MKNQILDAYLPNLGEKHQHLMQEYYQNNVIHLLSSHLLTVGDEAVVLLTAQRSEYRLDVVHECGQTVRAELLDVVKASPATILIREEINKLVK